jgi:hypothetical protein
LSQLTIINSLDYVPGLAEVCVMLDRIWKFFYWLAALIGVAVFTAAMIVLSYHPWRQSSADLLWRSSSNAITSTSHSWLGFLAFWIIAPTVTWISVFIHKWNNNKRGEILSPFKTAFNEMSSPIEIIGVGIVFVIWLVLFGCFLVKIVYDDHQTLVAQANAPKPACPTCPNCPQTVCPAQHVGHSATPGNSRKSLDIVCQSLGDCPKEELRSATFWLSSFTNKWKGILKAVPPSKMPDAEKAMADTVHGEELLICGDYASHYSTDVIALRAALSDRLGQHNKDMDITYKWAAGRYCSISDLEEIIGDLQEMAGKVLSLREQ